MKKYNKHYLKRDPKDQRVLIDGGEKVGDKIIGGEPILGEIAKHDCPLEDWHIKALNKSWKQTGIYFVEVKKNDSDKELRADLFVEATVLFEDGKIDKMPAKNIKTKDLQTLINEVDK